MSRVVRRIDKWSIDLGVKMYLNCFYLLILFINLKSLGCSVAQNVFHFSPATDYYTNILLNLLNGTDHSMEFVRNEVNKIYQHADRCEELFKVLINEQYSNTWKNLDDEFLKELLLSMAKIINKNPENVNIEQIRRDVASNSSKSTEQLVKKFGDNAQVCGTLFEKWLKFTSLEEIYDLSLFTDFFISMRVFNEKLKYSNTITNSSMNNEINKVFKYLKGCEIFYDILGKMDNASTHEDFNNKLLITKFLISMIHINKNMKSIGEKKLEGSYGLDTIDFEKDVINPIIFLDEMNTLKNQNPHMPTLNLSNSLKIISIIHKKIKKQKFKDCDNGLSSHQFLYSLYNCISLTSFNSYAMIFHGYKVFSSIVSEISSYTIESKRQDLMRTMLMIANQSAIAMENQSQIILRCDSTVHQEGVTFERLRNFMYFNEFELDYINENRLNQSNTYNRCEDLPKDLRLTKINEKFSCSGHTRDCKTKIVIRNDFGPTNMFNYSPDLIKKYMNMCDCVCDDFKNPNTVRNISLQEVRAKNEQGVVTGVRFGIDRGVIVLKIRVGVLENNFVDPKNQDWNSTYVSTKNPGGIEPNSTRVENNPNLHPHESFALNYDIRSVFLGDVVTPPGTIIQGVRFAICQEGVSIDLLASKIDNNGRILSSTAKWYTACDEKINRTEIKIPAGSSEPVDPESQNTVMRKSDTFVKFQVYQYRSDSNLIVVPFFDTQEVVTNPPVPLSGLGIFYRRHKNFGGFLGLYLSTFDFTYFMTQNYIENNLGKLTKIPRDRWFN